MYKLPVSEETPAELTQTEGKKLCSYFDRSTHSVWK
jgi:hypothetical protein